MSLLRSHGMIELFLFCGDLTLGNMMMSEDGYAASSSQGGGSSKRPPLDIDLNAPEQSRSLPLSWNRVTDEIRRPEILELEQERQRIVEASAQQEERRRAQEERYWQFHFERRKVARLRVENERLRFRINQNRYGQDMTIPTRTILSSRLILIHYFHFFGRQVSVLNLNAFCFRRRVSRAHEIRKPVIEQSTRSRRLLA